MGGLNWGLCLMYHNYNEVVNLNLIKNCKQNCNFNHQVDVVFKKVRDTTIYDGFKTSYFHISVHTYPDEKPLSNYKITADDTKN